MPQTLGSGSFWMKVHCEAFFAEVPKGSRTAGQSPLNKRIASSFHSLPRNDYVLQKTPLPNFAKTINYAEHITESLSQLNAFDEIRQEHAECLLHAGFIG